MTLNDSNEWAKTIIMDGLSVYVPESANHAERILERIQIQMSNRNAGVVLSTVRVMLKMVDYLEDPEQVRDYCRRMTPSLITLLSSDNEIKFVALKAITLIAEKRPAVIGHELKNFFCSFSDPFYVKAEKLEIIVKLANAQNIDIILNELKEYVLEVDVDFVRKCIKAIGRLAIKITEGADKCI